MLESWRNHSRCRLIYKKLPIVIFFLASFHGLGIVVAAKPFERARQRECPRSVAEEWSTVSAEPRKARPTLAWGASKFLVFHFQLSVCLQTFSFVNSHHNVHALNGRTAGTFAKVVEAACDNDSLVVAADENLHVVCSGQSVCRDKAFG